MTIRYPSEQGLTLIELINVVAIIGVLSAVALPTYRDYVTRTKINEAINIVGSAKSIIWETYLTRASMPIDTDPGMDDIENTLKFTRFVGDAEYNQVASHQSSLVITLENLGTSVDGRTMIFFFDATNGRMDIDCTGGTLQVIYRASACRP